MSDGDLSDLVVGQFTGYELVERVSGSVFDHMLNDSLGNSVI